MLVVFKKRKPTHVVRNPEFVDMPWNMMMKKNKWYLELDYQD
jgi:hypothetical protein